MQDLSIREGGFLITIPEIERFFSSVDKTESCWNWTGYCDANGYSRITIRSELFLGHVLSYLLHYGPIPDKLHVCHSCDNPKCVNPKHLWLGTHQENMKDRNEKGRCGVSGRYGEDINTSKLTEEQVREIRSCVEKGAKQTQMAKRFGVSRSTINSLIKRRTWKQSITLTTS